MARFKHLEIYQQSYKLCREIYRLKIKLPKVIKNDLGDMTLKTSIRITRAIVVANGSKEKLRILQQISLEIEVMWILLRMLFDFEGISRGEFQVLSEILADLSKQNQNWLGWSKKQNKIDDAHK